MFKVIARQPAWEDVEGYCISNEGDGKATTAAAETAVLSIKVSVNNKVADEATKSICHFILVIILVSTRDFLNIFW